MHVFEFSLFAHPDLCWLFIAAFLTWQQKDWCNFCEHESTLNLFSFNGQKGHRKNGDFSVCKKTSCYKHAFWKMASGSLSDLSNTFLMILWAQLQLR